MLTTETLVKNYMSNDKKYKKINEVTNRISQRMYKMQNLKKVMKELPKYIEQNGDFRIVNTFKLRQRNEIEIAVLELDLAEIRKEQKQIEQQFDNVFKVNKENSQYKKITKSEKRILEREMCALCCEEHNIKQIVTTNCSHSFGKQCFSQLLEHHFDYGLPLRCPCCRNEKIELTRYTTY